MKLGDEMNTIDELLYYCRESEPVGAVLLSGEWGCGKTYLVDHELKAILDGEAVILRISLFGITRPEEIHDAVKSAWMETYYRIKGLDSIVKNVKKFKRVVETAQILPEPLKGSLPQIQLTFSLPRIKLMTSMLYLCLTIWNVAR